MLQVFDEASTKGRFDKKSAVGISVKDEKIDWDTHGDEFDSASNARVPEEGGPALHGPHLVMGGGEDGVLDTALYKEPLGAVWMYTPMLLILNPRSLLTGRITSRTLMVRLGEKYPIYINFV